MSIEEAALGLCEAVRAVATMAYRQSQVGVPTPEEETELRADNTYWNAVRALALAVLEEADEEHYQQVIAGAGHCSWGPEPLRRRIEALGGAA